MQANYLGFVEPGCRLCLHLWIHPPKALCCPKLAVAPVSPVSWCRAAQSCALCLWAKKVRLNTDFSLHHMCLSALSLLLLYQPLNVPSGKYRRGRRTAWAMLPSQQRLVLVTRQSFCLSWLSRRRGCLGGRRLNTWTQTYSFFFFFKVMSVFFLLMLAFSFADGRKWREIQLLTK